MGIEARRTTILPSLEVPPFDGIGANEYIVDVAHDAVDFISTVDTPAPWELTIWYHTLNCGYRTRISGETDFPCIYGERVGMGRSYVRLADGVLNFDRWVDGLREGRSYVSATARATWSTSSLDDVRVGEAGSEKKLAAPGLVTVAAKVAARLDPVIPPPRPARSAVVPWTRSHTGIWNGRGSRIPGRWLGGSCCQRQSPWPRCRSRRMEPCTTFGSGSKSSGQAGWR